MIHTTIKEIARSGMFDLSSRMLQSLCWKYWHVEGKEKGNIKKLFAETIEKLRYNEKVKIKGKKITKTTKFVLGLLLLMRYAEGRWQSCGLVHPAFKYEIIKTRKKRGRNSGRKRFISGAALIEQLMQDELMRLKVIKKNYEVVLTDQTLRHVDLILYNSGTSKWKVGFQIKETIFCSKRGWKQEYPVASKLGHQELIRMGRQLKKRFPDKRFYLLTPQVVIGGKEDYNILRKVESAWDGIIYFWIWNDNKGEYVVNSDWINKLKQA